jgi:hypothetical protein
MIFFSIKKYRRNLLESYGSGYNRQSSLNSYPLTAVGVKYKSCFGKRKWPPQPVV